MQYISTRNTQKDFSFKDIFLSGLAPDGGLYVPKNIPTYSEKDLKKLKDFSYKDLAVKIILNFCSEEFNENFFCEFLVLIYSIPSISTEF